MWKLVVIATVAALATLPFASVLDAEFLRWDDDMTVVDNPHIRSLDAESIRWMFSNFRIGHYTPLGWLSYAADYALAGLDPRAFHRTGLALHALNAVLVLLLAERVLLHAIRLGERARWMAAALAAALFGVHPLRTEVAAWVVCRPDLIAAALVFASAWLYLRSREQAARRELWLALSLAAFAASLLAKSGGMALPLALLVLDAWPLRRFADPDRRGAALRGAVLEKLPFFALSLGAGIVAVAARSAHQIFTLAEYGPLRRLMQAATGIARHPIQSLAPSGLSPLYELRPDFDPLGPAYLAALAAVVLLTALLVLARRRYPAPLAAWVAYLVLVLPLSGLVQSGHQAVADRYSYVSCVPLAILVAGAAVGWAVHSKAHALGVGALSVVVLGLLASASRAQAQVWQDSVSLWRRVVALDADSYTGRWMLGVSLHQEQRFEEAIEQYQEARRIRAGVEDQEARYNLALSLIALGREGEAEEVLLDLLEEHPTHLSSLRAVRGLHEVAGNPELTAKLLARALKVDPSFVEGWLELASLSTRAGHYQEAFTVANKALELDPDSARAHARAGLALLYLERFAEAERHLRRAVELAPDLSPVRVNLGVSLERQGRLEEARAEWATVLEADPDQAEARRRLERAGG